MERAVSKVLPALHITGPLTRILTTTGNHVFVGFMDKAHKQGGQKVVVKLVGVDESTERNRKEVKRLEKEIMIAQKLSSEKDVTFPMVIVPPPIPNFKVLIMEYFGETLEKLLIDLKSEQKQFPASIIRLFGTHLFKQIQVIQKHGIVHRDIKPANIVVRHHEQLLQAPTNVQISLIDFGLSKIIHQLKHKKQFYKFTGNVRYASINTHKGYPPSKRDDLESLGYLLLELYTGDLPWTAKKPVIVDQLFNQSTKKSLDQIVGEVKQSYHVDTLCEGLPDSFRMYMRTVRALQPEETPPYEQLLKYLNS